jgi:DNA-binding MarR family transcriptional regulator
VTQSEAAAVGTSLLFDVYAVNQAVGRMLSEAMRDGPLTPSEYAIYSAVFELESATPTSLAGRLGMRLTTFMDQLRILESRGHAARIPHPTDGRSYKVVLTATGREAHRAANHRFEEAAQVFRSSLPGGEPAAQACLRSIREAAERTMLEVASPRPRAGRAG